MTRKKKEKQTEQLKPGDLVTYRGAGYKVVQLYESGDYAVIQGEACRISVRTKDLKKTEA